MNDKQQLAAMGECLAEQQPLCMAKRIDELEAQVRVMADSLNSFREFASANVWDDGERGVLLASIDASLSGNLPAPAAPEGWQLVPVKPTDHMTWVGQSMRYDSEISIGSIYCAMLAAAPSPDNTK